MAELLDKLRSALAKQYRVERQLGGGGMATVYLAEDVKHHRQVAVKVLRPELAEALGAERFLREIEIAGKLTHPHILPLYDSGEARGFLYYVMPFVEGESLRDRMGREKQLPVDEALLITREVADALSYAHSHGVVHRDIKPENILIQSGHAVVADFGIARAIGAAGGEKLTGTGLVIGTPAYMSPEQAAGSRDVDGRSDIYSLACVTYEMLAGAPPFTAPTIEGLLHRHLTEDPPPVTAMRATVSAEVDRALRRALSKNPADRFVTASQFGEALDRSRGAVPTPPAAPAAQRGRAMRLALAGAVAVVVLAVGYVALLGTRGPARGADGVPRLVVLPFENLGAKDDEYFADGITDEVTARLAGLSQLAVIARQSAMQYRNSEKTPQQIGQELDAQYILEATISWDRSSGAAGRVRVRPQLIRAGDATHVWADVYDEDLTEIFGVQSRIARKVVEALGVALVERETRLIATAPTANPEAHDLYLRGLDYSRSSNRVFDDRQTRAAIHLYERAVQLDPNFALAYAALGEAHRDLYWWASDRTEERLAMAKRAIDHALALDPDLPEARLALADYHYARFEYDAAIEELEGLRRRQPHNARAVGTMAAVRRRQGRFEDATRDFEAAVRLDPRAPNAAFNLSQTYWLLRDYPAAEREVNRAIALDPSTGRAHEMKIRIEVAETGRTTGARAPLAAAESLGLGQDQRVVEAAVMLELLDRRYDEALRRLRNASGIATFEYQYWFVPRDQSFADVFRLAERPDSARRHYEAARQVLEAKTRQFPADPRYFSSLGIVYAGLGRLDDAVRTARHGVELLPISKEAYRGIYAVDALAQVYAMVGQLDSAVAQLEHLISIPSHLSVPLLRLDPRWDPLRDHHRFRTLVAKP